MTKAYRTFLIAEFLMQQPQFDAWGYRQIWQQAVLLEQTSVPNWLKKELKKEGSYHRLFYFLHEVPLSVLMGL